MTAKILMIPPAGLPGEIVVGPLRTTKPRPKGASRNRRDSRER